MEILTWGKETPILLSNSTQKINIKPVLFGSPGGHSKSTETDMMGRMGVYMTIQICSQTIDESEINP